ncbi:hypothetical protein HYS28_02790 [Candidatus Uhrbacteria bacterium]|nr:hypothetical protein [Candidatus Uhrbacteria bacterium]
MQALASPRTVHMASRLKVGATFIGDTRVGEYTHHRFGRSLNARDPRRRLLALIAYVDKVMAAQQTKTHEPVFLTVEDAFCQPCPLLTEIVAKWRPEYTGKIYARNPEVVAELERWSAFRIEIAPKPSRRR